MIRQHPRGLVPLSLLTIIATLCTSAANQNPPEKDVALKVGDAPVVCSTEALQNADISNNTFISRAEYVNLLLDLAPSECPVIDKWLNEDPFRTTFEELSCLCHSYGGVDGENNCCLQAVGVPMLASFAVPDTYYPVEYGAQACAMIDRVIYEQCSAFDAGDEENDDDEEETELPTTLPTSVATASIPTSSPTASPTMEPTTPEREVGGFVVVDVEFVTEKPSTTPSISPTSSPTTISPTSVTPQPTEEASEAHVGFAPTEAVGFTPTKNNDSTTTATENWIQDVSDNQNQEESTATEETKESDAKVDETSNDNDDNEDDPSLNLATKEDGEEAAATDPTPSNIDPQQVDATQQENTEKPRKESSAGIILIVLLVISFLFSFLAFSIWGYRRRLIKNPWRKGSIYTDTDGSFFVEGGDETTTPVRSNSSRRPSDFTSDHDTEGRSLSFDGVSDPDLESGRPASKTGVVRLQFQDNLSVWGRRKQRRQERQQRREERQQLASMEPEHKSSITNILSTLELDLSGGTGRPTSPKSMMDHDSPSETNKNDHIVDIFDDRSDASSFDLSPNQDTESVPTETSVEDWLGKIQAKTALSVISGPNSSICTDDQSVVSRVSVDRSVASRVSMMSKQSNASSRARSASPNTARPIQRQANDPALQAWSAQRQQKKVSHQKLSFNRLPPSNMPSKAPASPSPTNKRMSKRPSASCSPASKTLKAIASSSFSPSTSPKPYSSQSVPSSPNKVFILKDSLLLGPEVRVRANSEKYGETKYSDTPPYERKVAPASKSDNNGAKQLSLDLTGDENVKPPEPVIKPPLRPSPQSQAFYESILRMEPPEEDESQGNAFAFEAARPRGTSPPTERYLV